MKKQYNKFMTMGDKAITISISTARKTLLSRSKKQAMLQTEVSIWIILTLMLQRKEKKHF